MKGVRPYMRDGRLDWTSARQSDRRLRRRAAFWSKLFGGFDKLASTHSTVCNPAKHVLHGARTRFGVDQIERRSPTQSAIAAFEPAPGLLVIAYISLRNGDDASKTVNAVRFEFRRFSLSAPALTKSQPQLQCFRHTHH